jgi:hypothetical protein
MEVRARFINKTNLVYFEVEDGLEVLEAQLGSVFEQYDLYLLDACGRELTEDSLSSYNSDNGIDLWCFPRGLNTALCTKKLLFITDHDAIEGADADKNTDENGTIQVMYRMAESTITLCKHCASLFVDKSMLEYNPHHLSTFVCQSEKVIEMGLIQNQSNSSTTTTISTSTGINSLLVTFELQTPVHLYLKRYLYNLAVSEQMIPNAIPGSRLISLNKDILNERFLQEKQLVDRLNGAKRTVMNAEDPNHQKNARDVIDYDYIHKKALEWMAKQREEKSIIDDNNDSYVDREDLAFLMGLLSWFKQSFFSWCNKPFCDNLFCPAAFVGENGKSLKEHKHMTGIGMGKPTDIEKDGDASRVELYQCSECKQVTRFPRYNNPSTLLKTRTGRCGEWANCFFLICRSLNLDARYVLDFTDHVWVEVYLPSEERYVHLDSCEMALDVPLLYEHGWGKKLTYILSLSRNGIVDVTPKYSRLLSSTVERRNALGRGMREGFLQQKIMEMDLKLNEEHLQLIRNYQNNLRGSTIFTSSSTKMNGNLIVLAPLLNGAESFVASSVEANSYSSKERNKRIHLLYKEIEAVSFQKDAGKWKVGEMIGRVSGSIEWRKERGELGSGKNI